MLEPPYSSSVPFPNVKPQCQYTSDPQTNRLTAKMVPTKNKCHVSAQIVENHHRLGPAYTMCQWIVEIYRVPFMKNEYSLPTFYLQGLGHATNYKSQTHNSGYGGQIFLPYNF